MENRGYILFVDDEEDILATFKEIFEEEGYRVDIEPNPLNAVEKIKKNNYDLVISDLKMPSLTGDDLLKEVRKFNTTTQFIMLTAYGTIENAVECMKYGAYDYLLKPIDFNDKKVWSVIDNAIEKAKDLKNRKNYEIFVADSGDSGTKIVCKSSIMDEILDYCRKISLFDFTVLIYGESGVGKELIARYIHEISPRKNKIFLPINCATIQKDIMEAEFFGTKKGVYTGADADRPGIIEQADGGTLFLDEISELPLELQAKFLRFLQEKEVRRIGDATSRKVDVRVICATNKDLKSLVKEGKFREDLYFRLEGIKITVPPLRERVEDIPVLAYKFLEDFNEKYKTNIEGISVKALQKLMNYKWEGNVRQLQNVINEACIKAMIRDNFIEPKHLPSYITGSGDEEIFDYNLAKKKNDEEFTKRYLTTLLSVTKGNISQAAKLANIERQSLQKILKKYGITASEFKV
ncbi:MAG: sigma-54 dependent transcriptional regulator [Hydrogenothermaceae bacterium]|nr:sigma-54 dependent transcriptional regulator [Hydrogenothermaceae bacterium]